MRIILLKEMDDLGGVGDVVETRDGYARNYLIPTGRAVLMTPENRAEVEAQVRVAVKAARDDSAARCEQLKDVAVRTEVQTKDGEALFGSVGASEIIKLVREACGVEVRKKEVALPDGAFRKVGEYPVVLKMHGEYSATIALSIVPSAEKAAERDGEAGAQAAQGEREGQEEREGAQDAEQDAPQGASQETAQDEDAAAEAAEDAPADGAPETAAAAEETKPAETAESAEPAEPEANA